MRLYLRVLLLFMCWSLWSIHTNAQAIESAEGPGFHVRAGAGINYWATNYSGRWKFGPAAWANTELWHGLGVQLEGHSLTAGGSLPQYKYYSGEGGLIYTMHRWTRVQPFAKAEMGFASLSYPRPGSTSHDTRTVWAMGGGIEYHTWRHVWTRLDYTYEAFPDFLSYVTLQKHTLNPNGITGGFTYHLR